MKKGRREREARQPLFFSSFTSTRLGVDHHRPKTGCLYQQRTLSLVKEQAASVICPEVRQTFVFLFSAINEHPREIEGVGDDLEHFLLEPPQVPDANHRQAFGKTSQIADNIGKLLRLVTRRIARQFAHRVAELLQLAFVGPKCYSFAHLQPNEREPHESYFFHVTERVKGV